MDISRNGAKLAVGAASLIPNHFELTFIHGGTRRRACNVIWRRGKLMGVQFV
jgi:hypothetical protein